MKWQDRRLLDLFGIEHPIIQAPMAGASLAADGDRRVRGGRPGLDPGRHADARKRCATELQVVKQGTGRGRSMSTSSSQAARARTRPAKPAGASSSRPYYHELGLAADAGRDAPTRAPFTAAMCDVVLEFKPKVVSFHFGMPDRGAAQRG